MRHPMVAQEAALNLRVPVVPPCQLFYAPTGHGRPDAFLVVRCCGQGWGWPLPGGQPYTHLEGSSSCQAQCQAVTSSLLAPIRGRGRATRLPSGRPQRPAFISPFVALNASKSLRLAKTQVKQTKDLQTTVMETSYLLFILRWPKL